MSAAGLAGALLGDQGEPEAQPPTLPLQQEQTAAPGPLWAPLQPLLPLDCLPSTSRPVPGLCCPCGQMPRLQA